MSSQVPPAWIRRPISITTVVVLTALMPLVVPVVLVPALIIDFVRLAAGVPGMRWTRKILLVALLIAFDFIGLVLTLAVWVSSPLGFGLSKPRIQRWCGGLMHWWGSRLWWTIRTTIPLEIDRSGVDDSMLDGNAIVIGRHRSLLDAILPAVIFGGLGRRVLYTLKEDLRWEPNIDLVGHIMEQRFVTRAPKDLAAELAPIRELAERIDDETVAIIFPEGTFFTEKRKAKVVKSLERRDPEHAHAARDMQYLLPPRPGGTLALLEGAPDADVIVLGHVGFEPFGTIGQIFSAVGRHHLITMRTWRISRADVPADEVGRIDWLYDTWSALDEWIVEQHERTCTGVAGSTT